MTTAAPVDSALAAVLERCTVRRLWAEQDEGPYHRDTQPLRRDIVEDREGAALQLGIRIASDADLPVQDATVEIWQCDALGRYSGFPPPNDSTLVTSASAPRGEYLPDQSFLRGRQRCDGAGMVEFHTIYPGWYPGRTVHIHVMVHVGETTLTSQLYLPDEISDAVLATAPYRDRPGRDTTNDTDTILPTGGEPAIVDVVPIDGGYQAAICLIVPADSVDVSA